MLSRMMANFKEKLEECIENDGTHLTNVRTFANTFFYKHLMESINLSM